MSGSRYAGREAGLGQHLAKTIFYEQAQRPPGRLGMAFGAEEQFVVDVKRSLHIRAVLPTSQYMGTHPNALPSPGRPNYSGQLYQSASSSLAKVHHFHGQAFRIRRRITWDGQQAFQSLASGHRSHERI